MHTKKIFLIGVVGVIVGAAGVLGFRFFTYAPEKTHYHANFAVYINGEREAFKDSGYYEEEAGGTCSLDTAMVPEERAHMHDNIGDVVHVEDHAVTWGQFFENLGWTVNHKLILTPEKLYVGDAMQKVAFLVNGQNVQDVTSRVIHDKDRLLVDFGVSSDTALQQEFKTVAKTAAKYDEGKDPASCMSGSLPSMQERMRHMF